MKPWSRISASGKWSRPLVGGAFTLIELLAVIAIIAIIAAFVGPAIFNLRKGDAMLAANRQMLGAVARARQLAMADRTTVYMIFVPTNFWSGFNSAWWTSAAKYEERVAATNVADKQLTGYTFVSLRSAGDQPGQGVPRYLSQWQTLPESTFIPEWKFTLPSYVVTNVYFRLTNYLSPPATNPHEEYRVHGFSYTNNIPFPLETATTNGTVYPLLPYVAFNYLGQPIGEDGQPMSEDVFIPLAHGSVAYAIDSQNKRPRLGPPSVLEKPPGNSTNSFNLIRIDHFTGRARLERQEIH